MRRPLVALSVGATLLGACAVNPVNVVSSPPACSATGLISTFAGNGSQAPANDGGAATGAGMDWPHEIGFDSAGNAYISEYFNGRVRKVAPNGTISTWKTGMSGPVGIVGDGAGNLYVADDNDARRPNNNVLKLSSTGAQLAAYGMVSPTGLAIDGAGNVYSADFWDNSVNKIDPAGNVTVVATGVMGAHDVAVGAGGVLYASSKTGHVVYRIEPGGAKTVVAGTGTGAKSRECGPGTQIPLHEPNGLALDAGGNLYIAEQAANGGGQIRRLTPNGTSSVFAGSGDNGSSGADGSPAISAAFNVHGVTIQGNFLYLADHWHRNIRRVNLN
ncbi:MAG: hypothetical protein ACKVWR_19090 [Acidimicrobiales bacterium]